MMNRILRILWGLIALLSIAWMALGAASATQLVPEDSPIADFTAEVSAFAATVGADTIDGYSLPAFFLASGLAVFLISAFFFRRNSGRIHAQRAERETREVKDVPPPFPEKSKQRDISGGSGLRRQSLAITALAFVAVFLLWNNRDLDIILYPIRLFVTFIHEAGHVLAALISGGQVQEFTVSANGSGYAVTAGGNRALIIPAGYLGAALFGSLLFLLSNRAPRWLPGLAIVLGALMIGLTAIYARPDESGMPISMFIGVGFGLIILLLGAKAPLAINQFVLSTLAVMTALAAVLDLWHLVGNAGAARGDVRNDAAAFSQEIAPLLPASVVAFVWAAIAIGMLGLAVYFGTVKPLRQEIDSAVTGHS